MLTHQELHAYSKLRQYEIAHDTLPFQAPLSFSYGRYSFQNDFCH